MDFTSSTQSTFNDSIKFLLDIMFLNKYEKKNRILIHCRGWNISYLPILFMSLPILSSWSSAASDKFTGSAHVLWDFPFFPLPCDVRILPVSTTSIHCLPSKNVIFPKFIYSLMHCLWSVRMFDLCAREEVAMRMLYLSGYTSNMKALLLSNRLD